MNLLIEIVGKEALKTLFIAGAAVVMMKVVQAKEIKGETPAGPIEMEF